MYVSINHSAHLLLLLVLSLLDPTYAQTDVVPILGSACTLSQGEGVCELIFLCQSVWNDLQASKWPEKICGYAPNGKTLIACCPLNNAAPGTTTTTTTTTTLRAALPTTNSLVPNRLATQMCELYAQVAANAVPLPTAFSINQPLGNPWLPKNISRNLIVGGGIKVKPKEFPHMAAVGYRLESKVHWDCGGTLISNTFVLTAAHCTVSPKWGIAQWVGLGDINLQIFPGSPARPQYYEISERIRHPFYRASAQYNDIALLRLQKLVMLNAFVKPACLDVVRIHPAGEKAMATGWGIVDWFDETGSEDLMKVTLPIVDYDTCAGYYTEAPNKLPNGINHPTQICAGEVGKDTCQGDSGGPLFVYSSTVSDTYDVIGVTSFGQVCRSVSPGIYTRVSYYVPWIESIVWPALE